LLLSSPGVQTLEESLAIELAAMSNDRLSQACRRHHDRLAGLAALAPQNPKRAAESCSAGFARLAQGRGHQFAYQWRISG
jgi:predicted TIM-barrel fold metal-dependent hydrolase